MKTVMQKLGFKKSELKKSESHKSELNKSGLTIKKLFSLLVIFTIITQVSFQGVFAAGNNLKSTNLSPYTLTANVSAGDETNGNLAENADELTYSLHTNLQDRATNFSILYLADPSTISDDINQSLGVIFSKDQYLFYSIHQISYTGTIYSGSAILDFTITYFGTPDENYVTTTCSNIITSIITPEDSDLVKIEKLHDYLVTHLQYDNTESHFDPTYALKYGTTTCQGYTMLMNKLLSMVGIKSMIIENDTNHMWNLVYINNCWYHIDVTWDDPVPDRPGEVSRTYFMVSDDFIRDAVHTWDETKYPKADAIPVLGDPGPGTFTPEDITSHWGKQYIQKLIDANIINGYEDMTFRPNNTITRAEFCKLIIGALAKEKGYLYSTDMFSFYDVDPDAWYSKYVETASGLGFVNGVGNDDFDPNAPITREQMAKILACVYAALNNKDIAALSSGVDINSFGLTDTSNADGWALDYIKVVLSTGIMVGDNGQFNPQSQVTRAQTATVICRLLGF